MAGLNFADLTQSGMKLKLIWKEKMRFTSQVARHRWRSILKMEHYENKYSPDRKRTQSGRWNFFDESFLLGTK